MLPASHYSLVSAKGLKHTVLMSMLPEHFRQLPWHQCVQD